MVHGRRAFMIARPMKWFPLDNFRSPAALALFLLTAVIGVAVDLATKAWAFNTLLVSWTTGPHGRPEVDQSRVYEFIPGWLHFQVTVNHGAVFGLGQGKAVVFLLVSVLAIGFLGYLFATSRRQPFFQFLLGMLLAGVVGNMYDRLVHGHVRDMIYALPGWHWPGEWMIPVLDYPGMDRAVFPWIFNVADTLLCVGVALMVIYSFFAKDVAAAGPSSTATGESAPAGHQN